MARFEIPSFKYGLDTRRDVLTSTVGTLTTANNVFVNQGGELVKRLPFIRWLDLNYTDSTSSLQGVFFGLVVDNSNFTVFGSSLLFGATVTQSQPTLSGALPASIKAGFVINYVQLKHPSLTNDSSETYNATYHRMTKLVYVSVFNGLSLCVAEFSDGNRFLYYNGDLVQHSANGLVLEGRVAVTDLSNDLLRQFRAVQWNGIANTDEALATENGSTIINSPPTDYFGADLDSSSTSGLFGVKFISKDNAATPGVRAIAKFKVTNAGTFEVLAPINIDGTGSTNLCGGNVTAGTIAACVTAIIRAINDFTSFHGYSAVATAATVDEVQVNAPEGFDLTTAIDLTVNATAGGTTGAATGATPFTARFVAQTGQLNGGVLIQTRAVTQSQFEQIFTVGATAGVQTTGGAGTTVITITPLPGAIGQPMQARTGVNGSSPCAFSAQLKFNGAHESQASFSILVTNGAESVTLNLTVYLVVTI
jgi:hypothetical protein